MLQKKRQHAEHAQKEADNAARLHPLDQHQSSPKIFYLCPDEFLIFRLLFVLAMKITDECSHRQETIGVRQHQQRDCRKQQGRCID